MNKLLAILALVMLPVSSAWSNEEMGCYISYGCSGAIVGHLPSSEICFNAGGYSWYSHGACQNRWQIDLEESEEGAGPASAAADENGCYTDRDCSTSPFGFYGTKSKCFAQGGESWYAGGYCHAK